jgi:hypothetical protein
VPSLKHFAERSEELVKRPRPPDPIQISSNLGGKGWKRMEKDGKLYNIIYKTRIKNGKVWKALRSL